VAIHQLIRVIYTDRVELSLHVLRGTHSLMGFLVMILARSESPELADRHLSQISMRVFSRCIHDNLSW
jgi:hypothetical protein